MIELMIALWLVAVAVVLYIYFIHPMIEKNYQDKIKLELIRQSVFDALQSAKWEPGEKFTFEKRWCIECKGFAVYRQGRAGYYYCAGCATDAIPDTVDELIAGFENEN